MIGRERTVTRVSGVYEPPLADMGYTKATVHMYDKCMLRSSTTTTKVKLELGKDQIAVIVWKK